MLKFYQKLGFGVSSDAQVAEVAEDISGFDLIVIVLILALIIYFGFQPSLFLGGMTNV